MIRGNAKKRTNPNGLCAFLCQLNFCKPLTIDLIRSFSFIQATNEKTSQETQ
jgi:hypothetical protein